MKTTIVEDGLDIFVPDEEMVEMYKIIRWSDYTSPLKYQLLNEMMKLIPFDTLENIEGDTGAELNEIQMPRMPHRNT